MEKLKRFWEYTNKPEDNISILIASYNTKIELLRFLDEGQSTNSSYHCESKSSRIFSMEFTVLV